MVMNCLNGERFLKEAIDSVFTQTFDDWEIVFWDNASTDKTGEIARSYGEKLKYFRAENTEGLGIARNAVFDNAKGEFIAILDADDIWLPEKLEKQLPLFDNPSVGMTFSNSMFFNDTGNVSDAFSQAPPYRGNVFGCLLSRNFMSTETMMFRKSHLDRLSQPWFQKDFVISMDYDLTLRMALVTETDYVDEVLSRWRIHTNSWSMKKRGLAYCENEALVERLLKDFPETLENYAEEIKTFRQRNDLRLGAYEWSAGKLSQARKAFRRNFAHGMHFKALHFATYLYPFSWSQEGLMKLWALSLKCRGGSSRFFAKDKSNQ